MIIQETVRRHTNLTFPRHRQSQSKNPTQHGSFLLTGGSEHILSSDLATDRRSPKKYITIEMGWCVISPSPT